MPEAGSAYVNWLFARRARAEPWPCHFLGFGQPPRGRSTATPLGGTTAAQTEARARSAAGAVICGMVAMRRILMALDGSLTENDEISEYGFP